MFIISYFGISVATTRWVILLKSLFLPSFAYKKKALLQPYIKTCNPPIGYKKHIWIICFCKLIKNMTSYVNLKYKVIHPYY